MARILRGVGRGVRAAALPLALRYAILGTLRRTTAFADQSSARSVQSDNHPSGVAEPSHADELFNGTLKQSRALVDVTVIDHFIVAGTSTLRFAERGLL
jgi:RadC-like JAB domain